MGYSTVVNLLNYLTCLTLMCQLVSCEVRRLDSRCGRHHGEERAHEHEAARAKHLLVVGTTWHGYIGELGCYIQSLHEIISVWPLFNIM